MTFFQVIWTRVEVMDGADDVSYGQHHNDMDIGVAVIDGFTHYILQYLETLGKSSKASLQDFVSISSTSLS